jgi:hypothetical protein
MNPGFEKPLWIYAIKGVATATAALIIKAFLSLFTWLYYTNISALKEYENYFVHIVIFATSLIIYNSVIGLLTTFDIPSANEYLALRSEKSNSFGSVYGYKTFIVEAVAATAAFGISALLGAFSEIGGMFYLGEGLSPYRTGILPFAVTVIIIPLIYMHRRYEAVRYWRFLDEIDKLDDLRGKVKVIIRLAFIIFLYPTVLPFTPFLLYLPITLFSFLTVIAAEVTVVGLILIILGIIMLIRGIKTLSAIRHRKRFISALNTAAADYGYIIGDIKNPYRSVLSRHSKFSFNLNIKGKSFSCLVIGGKNRRVPVCFFANGDGCFRYRLGTTMHHVTLSLKFDYSIDGSGAKILILDPTPRRALVCDKTKEKVLFNADRLWDYVVYEAEAFIKALERGNVGRYDIER